MTTQIVKLESAKIVSSAIAFIGQAAREIEEMIQDAAVQCVLHSHVHGNVDLAKHMLEAIKNNGKGGGVRHTALKNYLLTFGAIREVEGKKGTPKVLKLNREVQDKNILDCSETVATLLNTKWYTCKKPVEKKALAFDNIGKSIDKFVAAVASGDDTTVTQEQLADAIRKLQELQSQMQSAQ